MMLTVGTVSAAKLYATFGTPGSNASYSSPTYTWTGSTSNLMTVFEFANGELANYSKLTFTFSNLVDGPVRMGYYVGSTFTEFGSGYYSAGEKTVDLTALDIDLSTVTKIAFGGRSNAGSCDILATDVYLENSDIELFATFGTPGGNASYSSPTYTWTGNTNNLMQVFSLSNGELTNFDKLVIYTSNLSTADGQNWRVNFAWGNGGSDNMTIGTNGKDDTFYSAGTKTITMSTVATALADAGKNLADITAIRIGGNTSSGSIEVLAKQVQLIGTRTIANASFGTPGGSAEYNAPTYTWKAATSNLMDMYSFSNGELANFETLYFTTANYPSKDYRVGYYVGSTFTEFGNGFYSAGDKNVDLTAQTVDLSTVTKLSFGGRSCEENASYSIDIQEGSVYLKTRQFTVGQKSTVCLPYALTEDEVTAVGGEFYELTSVADGTLHFTKVTETTANKPYVYIPTKEYPFASVALTKTPVAVSETYPISYTVNGYTFTGVTKKETVPVGAYGYNASDGTFSKVVLASGASESAVTINARRAYIIGPATSGSGAPANLNVVFGEDEATDIENISVQDDANAPIYNVLGQRVDENYKGIIIKNGKKYLVR